MWKRKKKHPHTRKHARIRTYARAQNHRNKQSGKDTQMREKKIEQALVSAVRQRGGLCPKWVSPGLDGVPDRIILLPDGKAAFAELKAPGEKPRPLQAARIRRLRALGYKVYVIDNTGMIGGVLDEVSAP